jgi:putative endonuclease
MKKFKRHRQCFIYIVQCKDGTYYTGYTNDLEKRIKEHNNSKRGAKYLRGKLPVKLVYAKEYSYYKRAVDGERAIKKLSHKEKQELVKIYASRR